MALPFRPDFKEELHPRGHGGKFAAKPHAPKVARRRRPAPAVPAPVKAAAKATTPAPKAKRAAKRVPAKPMRFDSATAVPKLQAALKGKKRIIGQVRPPKPAVPFTFTDETYREHVKELEIRTDELRGGGVSSETIHREVRSDGKLGPWRLERAAAQAQILQEVLDGAKHVPRERKAIFAGGLGGAGKGTILGKHASVRQLTADKAIGDNPPEADYLTVNPDDLKEIMATRNMIPDIEGMSPMEANTLIHEEASDLAKDLADMASKQGINVIWDITMASDSSVQGRIDRLTKRGYEVDGLFVNVSMETSRERAEARHRRGEEKYRNGLGNGGRFLPAAESVRNAPTPGSGEQSKNAEVFGRLKDQFGSTIVFDNNGDGGPTITDRSGPRWAKTAGQAGHDNLE